MSKRLSNRELRENYDWLNAHYFDGRLPQVKVWFAPIVKNLASHTIERGRRIHARTYFVKQNGRYVPVEIRIQPRFRRMNWRCYAWIILVHEMIHVELGCHPDCKVIGGRFHKRAKELIRQGVLDCAL